VASERADEVLAQPGVRGAAASREIGRVRAVADASLSPVIRTAEDISTKQGPISAPEFLHRPEDLVVSTPRRWRALGAAMRLAIFAGARF